jgi:transposase
MGMNTRQSQQYQDQLWVPTVDMARSPGHPFYQRLNARLDGKSFDTFVEGRCRNFYATRMGRPSLVPGVHFRSLLIGYFEGIDSERGIAWRLADSLALREFVHSGITEQTPDHSTLSRTRRLIRSTGRSGVNDQESGHGVAPKFGAGLANRFFKTRSRTLTPSRSGAPHLAKTHTPSPSWEILREAYTIDSRS